MVAEVDMEIQTCLVGVIPLLFTVRGTPGFFGTSLLFRKTLHFQVAGITPRDLSFFVYLIYWLIVSQKD